MANNVNQESKQDLKSEQCCANCAKSLAPVRLDWSFVIDEMRQVVDLDKGIFYTIKEVLLRPGQSVRNYLRVDRSKFMRPFLFLFILSAISTFVTNPRDEQDNAEPSTITESRNPPVESEKDAPSIPPSEETSRANKETSEKTTQAEINGIELNFVSDDTDSSPTQEKFHSTLKSVFKWSTENSGWTAVFFVVVFTPWIKLFFKKSPYNSIEVAIMFCYISGVTVTIAMFGALIQYALKVQAHSIGQTVSNLYAIWAIGQFFEVNWKGYIKVALAFSSGMIFFVGSAMGLALLAIHFKLIS